MAITTSPHAVMSASADVDTPMVASPVDAPAHTLRSPPVRVPIAAGSLPIRTASGATSTAAAAGGTTNTAYPVRKLVRRDSLERREAFLKGKEGSRQRRRWENDRLLSNPWAEPPLPSDWEIRPTYPRRNIPYYLAPLWDAAEFQRAVEARLSGSGSRRGSATAARKRKHGSLRYPGMSPIEETATSIPKEVKARLKKSRAAKGLLMDLEEEVRGWVMEELTGSNVGGGGGGAGDASVVVNDAKNKRVRAETMDSVDSGAVVMDETDEEDEEIVFVGRKGVVVDRSFTPTTTNRASTPPNRPPTTTTMLDLPVRQKHNPAVAGMTSSSPPPTRTSHSKDDEQPQPNHHPHRSKMIYTSPETDHGASFARWLVHCVGSYYGLRTWSVTRQGSVEGGQVVNTREAYVGFDERGLTTTGFIMGSGIGAPGEEGVGGNGYNRREVELPRPLWGMV